MDRALRALAIACWLLLAPALLLGGERVVEGWPLGRWDPVRVLGRLLHTPVGPVAWLGLLVVAALPFRAGAGRATTLRSLCCAYLGYALLETLACWLAIPLHPMSPVVLGPHLCALICALLAASLWWSVAFEVIGAPRAESLGLEAVRAFVAALPPGLLIAWLLATSVGFLKPALPALVVPFPVAVTGSSFGVCYIAALLYRLVFVHAPEGAEPA